MFWINLYPFLGNYGVDAGRRCNFEIEYFSKRKDVYEMKLEYARFKHETESLHNLLRQREYCQNMQKTRVEVREREMDQMMKDEVERQVRETSLGGGCGWGDSRYNSFDNHQYNDDNRTFGNNFGGYDGGHRGGWSRH